MIRSHAEKRKNVPLENKGMQRLYSFDSRQLKIMLISHCPTFKVFFLTHIGKSLSRIFRVIPAKLLKMHPVPFEFMRLEHQGDYTE